MFLALTQFLKMQIQVVNMTPNHPSEFSLAMTAIAVGFGGLMKVLVEAEPVLASLSYLVAIVAGFVTMYYKFKKKG